MAIKVGDTVPTVTLRTMGKDGIEEITTDDLLGGKKVVLFALPGAFTPTCSSKHVPGYIERAGEITAKGVDTIACISVNDAFVMDAWGADLGVGDKVKMLADGNADFAISAMLAAAFGFFAARRGWIWKDPIQTLRNRRSKIAAHQGELRGKHLDDLLAKIHREGLGSLSQREKDFLKRMSGRDRS